MSDEAALLRAIGAHPDEDTPRLMYADWLDEHGRAERAEYIRVQIARLRKLATGEDDAHLYNREVELYRAHAAQWLRELMPPGYAPAIVAGERGFFAKARATVGDVLRATDHPCAGLITDLVLSAEPRKRGEWFADQLDRLINLPHFTNVSRLRVLSAPEVLHPSGVLVLAAAHFPRLAELDVSHGLIGNSGVTTLSLSKAFPALRVLDVSVNDITDGAWSALEGLLLRLERADLRGNGLLNATAERLRARFPHVLAYVFLRSGRVVRSLRERCRARVVAVAKFTLRSAP
jgi:uncharacterized protein (TIGR02996 family)